MTFKANDITFLVLRNNFVGTGDYSNSTHNAVSSSFSGKLVIPERVKGPDDTYYIVKEIGPRSFMGCYEITSVFVPSSIEIINEDGLRDLINCTKLTFGHNSKLRIIKCLGMVNLYKIKSLVFTGKCLQEIGELGLAYAFLLEELVLPSSITRINESALVGLREIKKLSYCGVKELRNDILTKEGGSQTNSTAEIYVTNDYQYDTFGGRSNLKRINDKRCIFIEKLTSVSKRRFILYHLLILCVLLS